MLLFDYLKVIHRLSTGQTTPPSETPFFILYAAALASICGKAYNVDGVGLDICAVASDPTGLLHKVIHRLSTSTPLRIHLVDKPTDSALYKNSAASSLYVSRYINLFSGNSLRNHHHREYLKAAYKSSGLGNKVKKKIGDNFRTLESVSTSHIILVRDSDFTRSHLLNANDSYFNRYIFACVRGKEDETFDLDANPPPLVPPDLIKWLDTLKDMCGALERAGRVVNVEFASSVRKYFDEELDKRWNDTDKDMKVETYVKIKKLAALLAVGRNFASPIITRDDVRDALDVLNMEREYLRKDINNTESFREERVREIVRILERFFDNPHASTSSRFSKRELHGYGITPISHVINCCKSSNIFFKDDSKGVRDYVHEAIKILEERGILEVIPAPFKFKDAGSVLGGFVYLTSRHQEKKHAWAHLVGK